MSSPAAWTRDDVVALLVDACAKAGSLRAWARRHGVSAPYVSDIIRGKRDPGPAVLDPLGFTVVTRYVRTYTPKRARHAE